MTGRQPTTWDEYDGRPSPGRSDSGTSSVRFEQQALLGDRDGNPDTTVRQRRRSSVTRGFSALGDIGGVNSIRSFGRSWRRAAVFPEVIPQRPSFVFAPDQEPAHTTDPNRYGRSDIEAPPRTSLLRQHLEASTSETAVTESEDDVDPSYASPLGSSTERKRQGSGDQLFRLNSASGSVRSNSMFSVPPHLAAPDIVGSWGSYRSYGTMHSEASHRSMLDAGEIWRQQQEAAAGLPDGQRPAILVREVEQEGKIVLAVSGQSTLPQTVLNSTNVLIGVGLLSLPMGIRYAGWVPGLTMLILCAGITSWTAGILAKCMDLDPTIITFSDIAYISFGARARVMTSILFSLELLAACVALIVLFADSLSLLFPGSWSVTEWKILCTVILVPLQFAPLALLSFTSFVGILCCMSIVLIVILCGLMKTTSPGSLIEPASTYLFPANWMTLPLSLGLLMSPWGGHSVFPNIYRDMRHPHKYTRAVTYTFSFTLGLDVVMAVLGYVMFGDGVRDEITSNILRTVGYPNILNIFLVIVIAIIPLTKIPLNAQPIVATIEVVCGLRPQHVAGESSMVGLSATTRGLLKALVRIVVLAVFLAVSIVFPSFDSIMAFMGSALCFTICVTLPLAFYLKLFGHELSTRKKITTWFIMLTSLTLSIVGTVWAFLPKHLIGATE